MKKTNNISNKLNIVPSNKEILNYGFTNKNFNIFF